MFQFTHPGRGATAWISTRPSDQDVSIHAPREGCDIRSDIASRNSGSFNSRTPGGVRQQDEQHRGNDIRFQFTHPGRGATSLASCVSLILAFQFTHPGRGATDKERILNRLQRVSIHAPREGCDLLDMRSIRLLMMFQFTHPGRGATLYPLS